MSAPIMGGVPDEAHISEVGLGGCLISSPYRIGVGRMVMLYFDIGGEEVSAVAKILYEYPAEGGSLNCGAEFLDLDEQDFARLSVFINDQIVQEARASFIS